MALIDEISTKRIHIEEKIKGREATTGNTSAVGRLLKNLVVCLGTSNKRKEIVFSGAHKVLEKIAVKNLKCMAR